MLELYRIDEQLGVDPLQVEAPVVIDEQPPLPPGLEWPPPRPNWDEEQAEQLQREREQQRAEHAEIVRQATAELEPETPPARPDPPAPKRRWRKEPA